MGKLLKYNRRFYRQKFCHSSRCATCNCDYPITYCIFVGQLSTV